MNGGIIKRSHVFSTSSSDAKSMVQEDYEKWGVARDWFLKLATL